MVTGVAFNQDGTRFASASLDKTVQLWEIENKPRVDIRKSNVTLLHPHPVNDVAYAPDGKRLVCVGGDGMVLIWDAATGTKLFALPGHHDSVERGVFSPDGRWVATAGEDKTIRIWDMRADPADRQSARPLHVLTGHTDRIAGLCFSRDSRRLASTGGDQTIRIWNVATGAEALTLRGHPGTTCGVAFSPDGRLLVSSSTRDIKVWDAGTGTRVFQGNQPKSVRPN